MKNAFSILGLASFVLGGIVEILKSINDEKQTKKMVEDEVQKALAEKNEDKEEDEETEEEND